MERDNVQQPQASEKLTSISPSHVQWGYADRTEPSFSAFVDFGKLESFRVAGRRSDSHRRCGEGRRDRLVSLFRLLACSAKEKKYR